LPNARNLILASNENIAKWNINNYLNKK
jgi:hypothetical protein